MSSDFIVQLKNNGRTAAQVWLTKLVICLALGLGTLFLYAPVRHYDFVNFDDDDYITANPHVLEGFTRENVAWAFTHFHSSNWHPVTWLSHMLDVKLWGLNPGGHHLTSVLFHAGSAVLLFLVFTQMTGALWRSAFVAAVFAWHPLHVESVAWISERKDVLCAFFWILTTAAYLRYVRRRCALNYILVTFSFVLGLMCKPMIVTLPFVLLLLDYWPLRRAELNQVDAGKWRSLLFEKVPFLALGLLSTLIAISTQHRSGALKSVVEVPWQLRVSNAPSSYIHYLAKTVRPFDLAVFYPFPLAIPFCQVAGAIALLLTITILVLLAGKKHPYLPVGWLWYGGTLVPVIGVIQVGDQSMADRYTYIPLIGLTIAGAWGVTALAKKTGHAPLFGGVLMAATVWFMLNASAHQLRYWQNSFTLFTHALSVTSNNWLAHNNLSNALLAQPDGLATSKSEALEALRIRPNYPQAQLNLGVGLLREGHTSEALLHLEQARNLKPNWPDAHFNLGAALMVAGQVDDAIARFYETLRLDPDSVPALKALAWVRSTQSSPKLRDSNEAVTLGQRAVQLTSRHDPEVLDVFAAALAEAGRFDEAVQVAEQARNLAISAKKDRLASMIESRLPLYQLRLPYRASVR